MMSHKTLSLMHKTPLAKAVAFSLAFSSTSVFAQEQQQEEQKAGLEIIEVTAQKRVQNIMKVPVTVGTISADTLEESSSILLSEVDKFIPGFEFGDGSMTQAGISMRGISSPSISVGGDPSSASFYDDVYMPRAAQNVLFSDLERIEVLKGPQGTLFGRNAAMGVVNVVPRSPIDDSEGFAKFTIGTDSLKRVEAMVNTGLTDRLFLRANFLNNTQAGIVKNISSPNWNNDFKIWDLGARDHNAARLALLWQASDNTKLQFSYEVDDLEQAPPMAVGLSEFAYQGGADPFADRAENDVRAGVESRDMSAYTAKLTHDIDQHWSMKGVLSFREWETINREDEDGTAQITRYFDTSNNEDSDIMYGEVQVNYVDDKISAVTGFSYSKESVSQQTELNLTTDTVTRLTTGELNGVIRGGVAQQVAGMIGGNSDEAAAAVFGPGVTFEAAVDSVYGSLGFPMDHMWNPDEWAGALNALGFGDAIMGALGMPGAPLTGGIVSATGDLTYDLVSQQLGIAEIFGPSASGQFWQENVINTGDFTNWGIYADVDYKVTDKWNVIVGLRYSHDEKDFTWRIPETTYASVRPGVNNALFPITNLSASDSWSKVTGRLVTSYQLDENQMIFGSYSTGYKSGGFDSLVPIDQSAGQQAFAPEDSTNIEFGYKATLWDSVLANVSIYRTELDNFQLSVESKKPENENAIPTIINENRLISGVEFDLRWRASDSLTLGLVSEIRNTEIDSPEYYNSEGEIVEAQSNDYDAATNYTLTADWAPDFDYGILNLHVDYVFRENTNDQQADISPYKLAIPAYFKDREDLNFRLSWTHSEEVFEVGFWGKNVFDERYVESIGERTLSTLGTPFARINRGREIGFDVKYNF